jgi:DNA-binding MarR family transcriptional regulator
MENIYEEFGRWISILYRQFQIYINNALKDLDITSSEYIFLIKLYENEELSQEELSSIYYVDKAATARSLKRLEKKKPPFYVSVVVHLKIFFISLSHC